MNQAGCKLSLRGSQHERRMRIFRCKESLNTTPSARIVVTCIMIVYRLDLGESILCCLLRAESPGVTAGSIKKVNGLTNGEMCKWVPSNITVFHFLPSLSPCVSLRQRVALWDNLPSCSLFHSEPPEMLWHQPSGSKHEEDSKHEKLQTQTLNELYISQLHSWKLFPTDRFNVVKFKSKE